MNWFQFHFSSSSEDEETFDMTPRQCHGMDCINAARVGSKYCSDQCGLTVASLRSVPWYGLHQCCPLGQQVLL